MIDFHSHTRASDGEKQVEELIDFAISKNIKALAITDHDTIDALERAENYVKDKNILIVPGIEFDTKVEKGQMHILGLFLDYKNEELVNALKSIKDERNKRNEKYIEELNKMGFEITQEELKEISDGKIIGKPHFAKVFLNKGYVSDTNEMFDKYFNMPPLNQYVKACLSMDEVIHLIKKAGGLAILAHPQSLKLEYDELYKKLEEMKDLGLDGMECYHSHQTSEDMKKFREFANKLNLLVSKGSDYHGPIVKPDVDLGTGVNGNIICDEDDKILENMLKKVKNQNS